MFVTYHLYQISIQNTNVRLGTYIQYIYTNKIYMGETRAEERLHFRKSISMHKNNWLENREMHII